MTHTPTPWQIEADEIVDDTFRKIAEISDHTGWEEWPNGTAEANAQLIITAVNSRDGLLVALENTTAALAYVHGEDWETVKRARAAIKAAR